MYVHHFSWCSEGENVVPHGRAECCTVDVYCALSTVPFLFSHLRPIVKLQTSFIKHCVKLALQQH